MSSKLEKGQIVYVKLKSEAGRKCIIDNPWPGKIVQLLRYGQKSELLSGKTFAFDTRNGEQLELRQAKI